MKLVIGPACEHCGIAVREQYYDDAPKPFEVEAGMYHSAARCRDRLRSRLAELHALADAHNPKPPSPERKADFEARHRALMADPIKAAKAWSNIQRALDRRDRLEPGERANLDALWDTWDKERDPHEKAKLQMRLGESVASWMAHAEALERELDEEDGEADADVESLARRMWHRYIRAQSRGEWTDFKRWDKLTHDETLRGFRAIARMVLAERVRTVLQTALTQATKEK